MPPIIVNENILETVGIFLANLRMVAKQHIGVHKHVVEVDSISNAATLYVEAVDVA